MHVFILKFEFKLYHRPLWDTNGKNFARKWDYVSVCFGCRRT